MILHGHTGADGNLWLRQLPLFGGLITRPGTTSTAASSTSDAGDDDAGVPDFEPGTGGRRHGVPPAVTGALGRSRRLRTMQSFRHPPPRS